ncbi:hypothetical protein DFH08DRAFT_884997 [Mycena albidolilacea]|uniref:Transmembrane protein n=1 Tax=Mycena albidolilacea TaxID=1033008 RepID=A0AAD6ZJH0_9AGAR|nr:hypothetical protein DFH08DRAFT_884997 [Mycena albidolilacea]
MSAPRRIVVDDADPAIQYGSSGWFVADSTKLNTIGNYGPVYNGTSHATTTDSTLSFPFNGTSISVFGTIAITKDANNVTDPTWDCFIDEIKIENPNPTFQYPENNWQLCDQATIASGSHTLTIQVTSKGQPFYLDRILYTPLPTAGYDGAVLEYTNTDTAVSFGTGWREWGVQNVTQTSGAQVALNFHGTAVSLFGYVPTELPHNSSSGTYTIDGGPPVSFVLNGLAAQSATLYNALMFTTNTLTPATHNIVVTYGGDASETPLAVGTFYVTNTSTPSSGTQTSSSSGNSAASAASTGTVTTTKSSPVGAIVGGTLGCLAILMLIAALVFWCRRRRRREAANIRRTSANPFMETAAVGGGPATLAGQQQYSYASVPGDTYGGPHGYARPETPGSSVPQATAYPYVPPGASASVPSTGSQMHSPSPSTGNFSDSMSTSMSVHAAWAAGANPYASPVPSDGSDRPSSRDAPLAPLRRNQAPQSSQKQLELQQPVTLHQHEDSGVRIRMPPTPPTSEPEIVELPPGYSRD